MQRDGHERQANRCGEPLPRWFRWSYTVFVAILVPIYLWHHPPTHFLWLSNIALICGLVAAWTRSGRLASMLLVAVGWFELVWIIDFLGGVLLGGQPPFGIVLYMFDPERALVLRVLSLYHVVLPFLLFWTVWRFGFERGSWYRWLPIGWAVLVLSYLLTDPATGVNWVHGSNIVDRNDLRGWPPLAVVMLGCAAAWWLGEKAVLGILHACGRSPP